MQVISGVLAMLLLTAQSSMAPSPLGRGGAAAAVAPDRDYLGEEQPGEVSRLFAPGIVSLGGFERDMAISPDGSEILYGVCGARCTLLLTRRSPQGWSEPEEPSFAADPSFNVLEPAFSPDGMRLFYLHDRPPSTTPGAVVKAWQHQNIWSVTREGSGWSKPALLGPEVNGAGGSYHPSVAADGTLYYTRQEQGSEAARIFRAESAPDGHQAGVPLASPFEQSLSPYNACVSPDGRILVFCSRGNEGRGVPMLWASFRDDGGVWSAATRLDDGVNAPGASAQSCSFSPDGRFFFFSSVRRDALAALPARMTMAAFKALHESPANGSSDVYWVDAKVVRRLRTGGATGVAGKE